MQTRLRLMLVLGLLSTSSPALGVNVCGITDTLDLSGMEPLPFGGETIGIGPEGGQIVGASFDITFTATGTFDAANLGVWLFIHRYEGSGVLGISGAQLGWSGQGTFSHSFTSDALNGFINSFGNPYSTWFIDTTNLDVGAGPITGSFDQLVWRLTYATCPIGDINMDVSVNVLDLLAVINGWGACMPQPEPCAADVNVDGTVGVPDLLAVINNWQQFCPNCK